MISRQEVAPNATDNNIIINLIETPIYIYIYRFLNFSNVKMKTTDNLTCEDITSLTGLNHGQKKNFPQDHK